MSKSKSYRSVQAIYDRVLRPLIPRKIGVWNGVPVRDPKLFDSSDVRPYYEDAIISSLREHVQPTDRVVVVGGGHGVSATVAARLGEHVHTFEACDDRIRSIQETLALNAVENVDLTQAIVGPAVSIPLSADGASSVSPRDLPRCDVLEMDCEGSELKILQELDVRPRVIIVETHRDLGSPEEDVRKELDRLGYSIVDRGVEGADDAITILTAVRE